MCSWNVWHKSVTYSYTNPNSHAYSYTDSYDHYNDYHNNHDINYDTTSRTLL